MVSIARVIDWLKENKYEFYGGGNNADHLISGPKTITEASEHHITFIGEKFSNQLNELLNKTESKLIVVESSLIQRINDESLSDDRLIIVSNNPKSDISKFCSDLLDFNRKLSKSNIHPGAFIDPNAIIGKYISIGPGVVIEEDVRIGNYCCIDSNSVIKKGTTIGNEVTIGASSVIGGEGFGYAQNPQNGDWELFPHYGRVILGNFVSVGNNVCIDRGSLSDTVIHDNVKIDNLVHIAHNVNIGRNSLVIASAMIAGSVEIGENCWIAPHSCIRNRLKLGSNVTVGLASVVTKDVGERETVMGNPALPKADFIELRKYQKEQINKRTS